MSTSKNLPPPAGGYRGRFAPSPTGPLHAGSLVAALGSWLDARKNGGKWLLRMEDLDTPRNVPGSAEQIQSQLLACGLVWDEEPIYQSERKQLYQEALERLNKLKYLYPCTCTRQTIGKTLSELGIETPRHQEIVYPGTCRPETPFSYAIQDISQSHSAWRIALPKNTNIKFDDLSMGAQSQNLNQQVGDFVLRRGDGIFTYQLAVVVDDALQGITHIVRGEDLLGNTARQLHLQNVLGYHRPSYRHLPLVLDEYGEKLSKQTLATQIQVQDSKDALLELRKAATHLELSGLPDGKSTTLAEWLLAATHAWNS
nr:tRNA glutamyl-Q(34) synthetase GluQRS [Polynucleobacter asymbioticus]